MVIVMKMMMVHCDVSYINDGSGDDSMMVEPVMVIVMKMTMVHYCDCDDTSNENDYGFMVA